MRHRTVYKQRIEYDVQTGDRVILKDEAKHHKIKWWQFLSLSLNLVSLDEHCTQLRSLPYDKYYALYKAYVPNQDRVLRFMQYAVWFVSKLQFKNPIYNGFLLYLYDKISFGRYLFRFYYIFDSIQAMRTGSWGGSSVIPKILGKFMAACMVGCYPFEHCAFLLWYQPQLFSSGLLSMANLFWSRASKFWFAYLLAELHYYALILQGQLKENFQRHDESKKVSSSNVEESSH